MPDSNYTPEEMEVNPTHNLVQGSLEWWLHQASINTQVNKQRVLPNSPRNQPQNTGTPRMLGLVGGIPQTPKKETAARPLFFGVELQLEDSSLTWRNRSPPPPSSLKKRRNPREPKKKVRFADDGKQEVSIPRVSARSNIIDKHAKRGVSKTSKD